MYLGGNLRWVPLVRSPIRFDNFLVPYSFFSFDLKKGTVSRNKHLCQLKEEKDLSRYFLSLFERFVFAHTNFSFIMVKTVELV